MTDSLDDFTLGSFSYRGVSHDVYRSGEGPAVIVIAEIPGITPDVADFARRVRALGCTVILPVLFGDPGREVLGRVRRQELREGVRLQGVRRLRHPQEGPGLRLAAGPGPLLPQLVRWARRRRGRHVLHRRVRPRDDGRRVGHRPGAQPALAAPSAVLEEGQGERAALGRRPHRGEGPGRRRRVRARPAFHRRHGRARASGSRRCAGSSATASSASRSTRRRATPGASPSGPTPCSPATSSTSPATRPARPSTRSSSSSAPVSSSPPPAEQRGAPTNAPPGVLGHPSLAFSACVCTPRGAKRMPVPTDVSPSAGGESRPCQAVRGYPRCTGRRPTVPGLRSVHADDCSMIAAVVLGFGSLALLAGCGGSSESPDDTATTLGAMTATTPTTAATTTTTATTTTSGSGSATTSSSTATPCRRSSRASPARRARAPTASTPRARGSTCT